MGIGMTEQGQAGRQAGDQKKEGREREEGGQGKVSKVVLVSST